MTTEEKLKMLCQCMGLTVDNLGVGMITPASILDGTFHHCEIRLSSVHPLNIPDFYENSIGDGYRYSFFYKSHDEALRALEQWTPNKPQK